MAQNDPSKDELKIARNGVELAALLKERRLEMGLSLLDVDRMAGCYEGYTAHLETPGTPSGRNATHKSLEYWLGALGVGLALVPLKD